MKTQLVPGTNCGQSVPGTNSAEFVPGTNCRPAWLLHRPRKLAGVEELCLIAGPERIEAGWWDGAEVRRDYYVAANSRGETLWIFREHRGEQGWYLHGVFA
jgi:protein ImuB